VNGLESPAIDHAMLADTGWDPVRYREIEQVFLALVAAAEDPAMPVMQLRMRDLAWLLDLTLKLAVRSTACMQRLGALQRNAEFVLARHGGQAADVARLLGVAEESGG
jgi:hypothetical protein